MTERTFLLKFCTNTKFEFLKFNNVYFKKILLKIIIVVKLSYPILNFKLLIRFFAFFIRLKENTKRTVLSTFLDLNKQTSNLGAYYKNVKTIWSHSLEMEILHLQSRCESQNKIKIRTK